MWGNRLVGFRWPVIAIVIAVVGFFVLNGPHSVQSEEKGKAVEARKKLMKTQVKAGMDTIKKGLKAGDSAQMLKGSEMIAAAAAKIPEAFKKKDLSGKTTATARIWEKKSDFDGIAKTLGTSAKTFAVAVKTGDKAKIGGALKAVGANCGKCHKAFRKKKKKK